MRDGDVVKGCRGEGRAPDGIQQPVAVQGEVQDNARMWWTFCVFGGPAGGLWLCAAGAVSLFVAPLRPLASGASGHHERALYNDPARCSWRDPRRRPWPWASAAARAVPGGEEQCWSRRSVPSIFTSRPPPASSAARLDGWGNVPLRHWQRFGLRRGEQASSRAASPPSWSCHQSPRPLCPPTSAGLRHPMP